MTRAVCLFYEKAPGQARLGFLGPDDQLLEIWFDTLHRPNLIGSVHQARIDLVFPLQNRAIASLENGELVSLRIRKRDRQLVIVGRVLPVTIVAAPRLGKPWQASLGARVATNEMILLIDLPDQADNLQLSSRIGNDQRDFLMKRLLAEVAPVLPSGYGVILRCGGVHLTDFGAATTGLIEMWKAGSRPVAKDKRGVLFDAGDLLQRARRLEGNLPVIDDPAMANDLSVMLDDAVAGTMMAKCPLKCGGNLWCEQTHAVWSIDLDGNDSNNLDRLCDEAAVEIPRQIRLRGMSGPVLIDVPRLSPGRARRFRANLQNALNDDPRQPELLGVTRGGLLELRVPHGEMAPNAVMQDQPAQDALTGLRLAMQQPGFHTVTLAVSKEMADWLEGPGKEALSQLDKPLRLSVWQNEIKDQSVYILDPA